jgi:hypothetical protein
VIADATTIGGAPWRTLTAEDLDAIVLPGFDENGVEL